MQETSAETSYQTSQVNISNHFQLVYAVLVHNKAALCDLEKIIVKS